MGTQHNHPSSSLNFWRTTAIVSFILMLAVAFWRFGLPPETPSPRHDELKTESAASTTEQNISPSEQVDEIEKRKEELRTYWPKLVRVDLVQYTPRNFGGMSEVYIQVRNHMEYDAELIQVEIQYLLANGKVYKTISVPVRNIPANGLSPKVKIEDSRRGKTLRMKPVKLECKAIESEP